MFFWKISLRRRGNSNSPVHSISMSEWFLFFPPGPGPGSDFTEEALDEHDDEDDREEIGLSPASSRGPIFDCFLSLTMAMSNHSSDVCLFQKRFFQFSSCSIAVLIRIIPSKSRLQEVFYPDGHMQCCLFNSVTLIVYRNVSPWPDSATTCDPP